MDEEPGERITQLVDERTDEERYRLLSGSTDPDGTATGYLPPIDRLEIPALRLVDGPAGVRIPGEPATAFPAPIALAAAWNPSLAGLDHDWVIAIDPWPELETVHSRRRRS